QGVGAVRDRPRRRRNLRPVWWVLLLLGIVIGVCGYLGGTHWYPDPETRDLADLAFWAMLGGGFLALFGAMQLVERALGRGLDRAFARLLGRRGGR
ncbi:hypothetical protein PV736_04495, partial [Streptomyces scabiei]